MRQGTGSNSVFRPRRSVTVLLTAVALGAGAAAQASSAPEVPGGSELQHVTVKLSPSAAVTAINVDTMHKGGDGQVVQNQTSLAPVEAAQQLPVRVRTMWWHDSRVGTDFSQLKGLAGRFVLQWSVENLTAKPEEITYESNGAQYRQRELVATPLTVAASARVERGEVVIGAQEGQAATDGVIAPLGQGVTTVQWAALLAPPVLSPATTFTLVVESEDFKAPELTMTVEGGITTDPSVTAVVNTAFGAHGDAGKTELEIVNTVSGVSKNLTEARDFVDEVHRTLQGDVSAIAGRTFTDLQSSSKRVADQLTATSEQLKNISSSSESAIGSATNGTQQGLKSLVSSFNALLGDNSAPKMTQSAVQGCSVTLPQLEESEQRTITSMFALVNAQMGVVGAVFENSAESQSCRDELVATLTRAVGDPKTYDDKDAADACEALDSKDKSLACSLHRVERGFAAAVADLTGLSSQALGHYQKLGTETLMGAIQGSDGLAAHLSSLADELDELKSSNLNLSNQSSGQLTSLRQHIDAAIEAVGRARTELSGLRTSADAVERELQELEGQLVSGDPAAPGLFDILEALETGQGDLKAVGSWLDESGMVPALDAQVAEANLAGSTCDVDWHVGITKTSAAAEITAALAKLSKPDCSLGEMANATQALMVTYDQAHSAALELQNGLAAARAQATRAEEELSQVAGEVSDVQQLLAVESAAEKALDGLYKEPAGPGGQATGSLAEIKKILESTEGIGSGGVNAQIDALSAHMSTVWPDATVLPLPDAAGCPAVEQEANQPQAPGQAVIWLANRLYCTDKHLGTALSSLKDEIAQAQSAVDKELDAARTNAQSSLDSATAEIDALGKQLADVMSQQRAKTEKDVADLVADSKAKTEAQLTRALDDLSLSMNNTLEGLKNALSRSAEQSVSVSTQLSSEFNTLLLNLGQPGTNNRLGLIGKLYGITTDVGETGNVLNGVDDTVTSFADSRKGALRRINLHSAIYRRAQLLEDSFKPFSTSETPVLTVLTFTMGGE